MGDVEQHSNAANTHVSGDASNDASNDANACATDHVNDVSDDVAVAGLDTPVGRLSLAVTRAGVAMVGWCDPAHLGARSQLPVVADGERTGPVVEQLVQYFSGEDRKSVV